MLIRVKKSDNMQQAFAKPDGLEICLEHWIDWMRQDDRDLGAKTQACVKSGAVDSEHDGYDDDGAASDAAAARDSREIAQATHAMIEGLQKHHKYAIHKKCGVSRVWNYPNLNIVEELPIAEAELTQKLSKNIATRAFF